jgi:3-isopropylmalate/(R)-2-methylmalate dehydratase small subunit
MANPKPFTVLTERCVPLRRDHVDTDQVIPARFLKGTSKSGLGEKLFHDWRYLPDGSPNPEFELNRPQFAGAKILIAGHNFGCGSSREHAPWALKDYGFDVVLAVSFADIFKNNAMKNRVLPVALPEATILSLMGRVEAEPSLQVTVDLPAQTVTLPDGASYGFDINPFWKRCLVEGVDEIGYTLSRLKHIEAFESAQAVGGPV